ncbi:hypothetical protein [Bosea massiliensis]|uniref:Uncharacterized protein n=1 Tax=Bosea massiliensis TaxID=151419 RepID=A0ABW0P9F8_9HYPH
MTTLTDHEIDQNRDLIAADLLAALSDARTALVMTIAFLGRDQGTDRIEKTVQDLITICSKADRSAIEVIQNATHAGLRAQSFAERERELLAANNRHLEDARAARREIIRLLERERDATEAYVGQFISMGRRIRSQREALKAIIPYAESRVEDMIENDEANRADGIEFDPLLSAKAAAAVEEAKRIAGVI